MITYGQIYFETATPMQHASGRSPRGGDRLGTNHTSLWGVNRVEIQYSEQGDGT